MISVERSITVGGENCTPHTCNSASSMLDKEQSIHGAARAGCGRRILLGRAPDDFSAPAIAFDDAGNLICRGIKQVQRGPCASVGGIRDAARNRKAARVATDAAKHVGEYPDNATMRDEEQARRGRQKETAPASRFQLDRRGGNAPRRGQCRNPPDARRLHCRFYRVPHQPWPLQRS